MAGATQAGYYVWEIPGRSVEVHLHLDVVDRMLIDVMRGFAAIRKRGAEVGGILIGAIEPGDVSVVRIEDFKTVECDYKRGPSYLLTENDGPAFHEAWRQWQPDGLRRTYAVGYFRSNTRDEMSLASEDIELMDEYFPSPASVALLIKPYGTKVSLAGFFIREDGAFPETTPLEFPFRRQELSGEAQPPRRSMVERRPRERPVPEILPEEYVQREPDFGAMRLPGPAYAVTVPTPAKARNYIWIPLSFVFLLFGVALGMMIALARGSGPSRADAQDFSLGLTIAKADDSLSVKWDRQAPAIHGAQRGVLEIEDGTYTKAVDLDIVQLQSGRIIYRNSSSAVRFRLVVYPKARLSITEIMEWKQ